MLEELRMAELLCTRLCHDLTGPIGAVNNGAEFLNEEGFNLQSQAMELVTSSAFTAVTRLQFYRMAYGKVKEKLATDYFVGSKITLDWPDSHTDAAVVPLSSKMARILCNLLVVASAALSRGGTISVRLSQDSTDHKHVAVAAIGQGIKKDPDMDKIFAGTLSVAELNPRNVQLYLTKRFADDVGAAITYSATDENLELQITQPG